MEAKLAVAAQPQDGGDGLSALVPGCQTGCHISGLVVLGASVRVGSDNVLAAGARIFPGVKLPEGAIKF